MMAVCRVSPQLPGSSRPQDCSRRVRTRLAATSAASSNRAIPTATTSWSALPHAAAARAPSSSAARTPDPGSLQQTTVRPSGSDPQFAQRMHAPWAAIVAGDAAPRGAFFPLGAYLQVKAVSNPALDYIRALRLRVGSGATLLGVNVPDRSATWVTPGQEYNKGSYWRV